MSKKRYRPIDKYDEAMENMEVNQSQQNRRFLSENPYIKEDDSKYDKVLDQNYSIKNKPLSDLKDMYENADEGFIQAVQDQANVEDLNEVLSSPYLADKTPTYIADPEASNYQDMLKTQGDARNTWNNIWNTANKIDAENYKFTALRAERQIKKLLKEKQEQEELLKTATEEQAADIQNRLREIDSEIGEETRDKMSANEAVKKLNEKMEGRYVDNLFKARGHTLLDQESTDFGDYWMSG